MNTDPEVALSMLPKTDWMKARPGRGCIDELLGNDGIRASVPDIGKPSHSPPSTQARSESHCCVAQTRSSRIFG